VRHVLQIAAGIAAPSQAQAQSAPRYEADVSWPKPLPERWVLGGLGGLCVDQPGSCVHPEPSGCGRRRSQRRPTRAVDHRVRSGRHVVNSWGDPKLLDPRLHSCHVDKDNNIWIGAAPSGNDSEYTHDGSKMLLQIGKKGHLDSSDGTPKGKPLNRPPPSLHAVEHLRHRAMRRLRLRRRRRRQQQARRGVR